jgi:hypothetical protein
MEQIIPGVAFRPQLGICLTRKSRTETFVVLRCGCPVVTLRPSRAAKNVSQVVGNFVGIRRSIRASEAVLRRLADGSTPYLAFSPVAAP